VSPTLSRPEFLAVVVAWALGVVALDVVARYRGFPERHRRELLLMQVGFGAYLLGAVGTEEVFGVRTVPPLSESTASLLYFVSAGTLLVSLGQTVRRWRRRTDDRNAES
jgi:hypothetical protein